MSTVLKEEIYTTDLFMIKVTIFQEEYVPGSNISSFSLPQSTQIIENKTQLPNINGDENSKFNTFDQLPIID